MADWSDRNFKWQYDYSRDYLKSASGFADEWAPTIRALTRLLGPSGFATAEAKALDMLRKQAVKAGGKTVDMADGLLAAVKVGSNNAPSLTDDQKLRASALKFLAHVYLLGYSGNRSMWLHSAPKAFGDWPSVDIYNNAGTTRKVKRLLNSSREHFTGKAKKHIASCGTRALSWVHKTNLVLGHAGSDTEQGRKGWSRATVKKWFADPAMSEKDVDKSIATLSSGFKKITAMLNKGSMILTDHMGLRRASTQDEIDFFNAEAFTFGGGWEGLDVVYIEKNFFTDHPGNILHGEANWARIIIHELSHLICDTDDVTNGQVRYAWYGIGPHAGYPGSDCIKNADNWAFFAADCGGGLTEQEAKKALKIV